MSMARLSYDTPARSPIGREKSRLEEGPSEAIRRIPALPNKNRRDKGERDLLTVSFDATKTREKFRLHNKKRDHLPDLLRRKTSLLIK